MRRLHSRHLPLALVVLGLILLSAAVVAYLLRGRSSPSPTVPPLGERAAPSTATTPTTLSAPVPPATTGGPATRPSSSPRPFSWDEAGGIVWHLQDVDPTWLGQTMRASGFGWIAVYLGDGTGLSPPDASWIARFRAASGLPVGGWSVLRDHPDQEAKAAASLIEQDGLFFYIADAESDYAYTNGASKSGARFERSQQFAAAFRAAQPSLPAAVSSYCRPDMNDIDWSAWERAGFVFLPQAYVNELGTAAAPSGCVSAASRFFPRSQVHPTVASFPGRQGRVPPLRYAHLLAQAGTIGFSVYPAEVGLTQQDWQRYGQAISTMRIASRPS